MSLEEIWVVEDVESGSSSVEISEKFKEEVRRWWAWTKRVKKDEKRAKKMDLVLAWFLAEVLRNPDYDFIIEDVISNLEWGISSNFILGVISLIYMPISDKIRELSWKEHISFRYSSEERLIFDDNDIPDEIKTRLANLVEDIDDIVNYEPSTVVTQRLKEKIEKKYVIDFFSKVFTEFFNMVNIEITKQKSDQYVSFIISQIKLNLEKIILEEI